MKDKNKILDIFTYFTARNQRDKLCEEFRELQDELFRFVELGDECNLLTEIADVIILMLQFMYEYGYELNDLEEEVNNKINRTIKRIEDGYYETHK